MPPRLPFAYVARHRLERRLDVSPPASVVVVHGPAGAGKSVLLSAWYASRAEKRSWLTLDERDTEPLTFWTDISYASAGTARAGRRRCVERAVPRRVGGLGSRPGASARRRAGRTARHLMLDNAQVLGEGDADDGLRQLVDALPPSVNILIATRSRPDIALHRLRVEGRAVEIDARGPPVHR